MRIPQGDWQAFAKFFIGDNRQEAIDLFSMLKGIPEVREDYPLTIDFVETKKGLPVNLDMINCSLQQLEENTRIITKELFRRHLRDVTP
jgi:hypothetical protein